jgi:hypothetical protein
MIEMVKRSETLVAIHTDLSFIPTGNNVPQQAVLRICFNLPETLLTAVVALGPA